MSNLPSKWMDFVNNKELKRLHADINNTMPLKIQTAISILLAILSVILSTVFKDKEEYVTISICLSLMILVVLIYLVPYIIKKSKDSSTRNVFINGKDAITIFDEEIVYYVMTACEYSRQDKMLYQKLENSVGEFFVLEIGYYVNKAVEGLILFESNFDGIFGDGKDKISKDRLKNIIDIVDDLTKKHSLSIKEQNKFNVIKARA